LGPVDVLHVSEPTDGGVATVVRQLANDQREKGFTVACACPPGGELWTAMQQDGITLTSWNATREPGTKTLREALELRRIVASLKPELVHLHSSKAGVVGRLVVRSKRPTVFQPHAWSFAATTGLFAELLVVWERFAIRWTDAVVCVSHDEQRAGVERGIRAGFVVIPNGVDPARFCERSAGTQSEARARLSLPDGDIVLCAGRFHRAKGQDLLLEAWSAVREAVADATLVLVGDGPDRIGLMEHWAGDGSVRFVGSSPSIPAYLAAADVVVVPSRWEAGSVITLEAMASSRSVVVHDVAGMREALGDSAGAIIPVGQPAALAAAIVLRLQDPPLRAREGASGRRRVERLFDQSQTCNRMLDLYRALW